jgi:hypothetical protein
MWKLDISYPGPLRIEGHYGTGIKDGLLGRDSGGYSGVIRVLQRVNEKMVENISLRRQ